MVKPEEHKDLGPRSVGRLMIFKMPVIHASATIAEVEEMLLKKTRDLETINYVYATEGEKLVGVISIKEIFRLPKAAKISERMKKDLITVRPHTDRDRATLLAIEHNLKEIPVVDSENRLLGVMPYDAILRALREEHIEDVLSTAGVHSFQDPSRNITNASALTLVKKRLPWLLMGLGGSALAAAVIRYFNDALQNQILLAAFIPAVTYIAGAVGTQSETIFIRTAAIDKGLKFANYLWKELRIGLVISIILAVAMFLISFIFWQTPVVSIILGISFLAATLISMFVAVLLPWLSSRFRVDPAMSGGPMDTIISDILSIIIYFAVANVIFGLLS